MLTTYAFTEALRALGMSRKEAAEALGLHVSTVNRYAAGKIEIPEKIVIRLWLLLAQA